MADKEMNTKAENLTENNGENEEDEAMLAGSKLNWSFSMAAGQ